MKTRHLLLSAFCLLASVFHTAAANAADVLRAGTAKVNITPQKPKYPVHDSLYARTLLLEAGGTRVAFVALDLGGYTNEKLGRQAALEIPLARGVLLSATHPLLRARPEGMA